MTRTIAAALVAVLLTAAGASAQSGVAPGMGEDAPPGPPQGQEVGAGGPAGGGDRAKGPTAKACVVEMKAVPATVYGSECKEYCRPPGCGLLGWVRALFGCGAACEECGGCSLEHRSVLLKRTVKCKEAATCVLKDVPPCGPCAAAPPPGAPPNP